MNSTRLLKDVREQAEQIYNLFDKLAVLFRERLEKHQSEPRAISFSISGATEEVMDQLRPLLDIARKVQLLYARTGPAKEKGRLQTYYVPNRMLWPVRGLDPYGQHARVSLKASDLWSAAQGTDLPFSAAVDDGGDEQTPGRPMTASEDCSMSSVDCVVTVASWEDRFLLGTQRVLEQWRPLRLQMYCYKEYSEWSEENRNKVTQTCRDLGVAVTPRELSFDTPADNWRLLHDDLLSSEFVARRCSWTLRLSAQHNWSSPFFLQSNGCRIHYVYNRPQTYNEEWLSRILSGPLVLSFRGNGSGQTNGSGRVDGLRCGADTTTHAVLRTPHRPARLSNGGAVWESSSECCETPEGFAKNTRSWAYNGSCKCV